MYAKIFAQIFDSSIVEMPEVRFTFTDLLTLADQHGVVDMTHEAIARRTNRPIEVIRKTIEILESPDPRSRTPDDNGRRITRLDAHRDWGWLILNFDKFNRLVSEEQRKEKTRQRVVKHRQKVRGETPCNAAVTPCNAKKRKKRHVDVSVDVTASTDLNNVPRSPLALAVDEVIQFYADGNWDDGEKAKNMLKRLEEAGEYGE